MNIKMVLYCFFIPFSIWIVLSTNIDKIFKKNSIIQIRCFYVCLSMILSYLLVNFIMDLFNTAMLL